MPSSFTTTFRCAILLLLLLLTVTAVGATRLGSKVTFGNLDGVAQVANNKNHEIRFRKSFGKLNIEHNVSMSFDAQFPVASNSKLFTAVAAYQLQEVGLLNVTAPISDYLDAADFAAFGKPGMTSYCPTLVNSTVCQAPTMQQLLAMTSGIYDPLRCEWPAFASLCNPEAFFLFPGSTALMVGTFIATPLMFEPGTDYSYSNPGFILATYIIEKLSKMSFHQYLDQYIFKVVGMTDSYFDVYNGQFQINARRVSEYHKFVDPSDSMLFATGKSTVDFDLGSDSGAGGIISTAEDIRKFWTVLFNFSTGGFPLLRDNASLSSIMTPYVAITPPGPVPTFYGQGLILVCAAGDTSCALGPKLLMYVGGTLIVSTVNILDPKTQEMVQVFASSAVYNVSKAMVSYARASSGVGNFARVILPFASATENAVVRAWELAAEFGIHV